MIKAVKPTWLATDGTSHVLRALRVRVPAPRLAPTSIIGALLGISGAPEPLNEDGHAALAGGHVLGLAMVRALKY